MATGCASMARDGRRCPGQAWSAPATADPFPLVPDRSPPPSSGRVPRAHPVLQALPAVRIWYQGKSWPRAAPRWPGAGWGRETTCDSALGMTASGRYVMLRIEPANRCCLDPARSARVSIAHASASTRLRAPLAAPVANSIAHPFLYEPFTAIQTNTPVAATSVRFAASSPVRTHSVRLRCGLWGALVSPPLLRVVFLCAAKNSERQINNSTAVKSQGR